MDNVGIILFYPQMNGITTSLFDLYFNLKKYGVVNLKCYIFIDCLKLQEQMLYIKTIYKSLPLNKVNCEFIDINNIDKFYKNNKFNVLIVSFSITKYLSCLKFCYNKLIVLDSGLMFYDYITNNNIKNNYIEQMENVFVLGNRINMNFYRNNYYLYYHKFSNERLEFIKNKFPVINQVFNESVRNTEDTDEIKFKYMMYNKLEYQRWREITKGIYSENIGKMIFEFLWLGKKVHYSPKNKSQDDGLTDYLSLFNIDDNVEQNLNITKNEIENKLFMKKNDLILKLIMG